jgi:hypothetical protein
MRRIKHLWICFLAALTITTAPVAGIEQSATPSSSMARVDSFERRGGDDFERRRGDDFERRKGDDFERRKGDDFERRG